MVAASDLFAARSERPASMRDSKFWRIVAVAVCVGIFYVGHGLHSQGLHGRGSDGWPSLENTAHAGGVAVDAIGANAGRMATRLYTTNETGTILYVWDAPSTREGTPAHVATIGVPKDSWLPPPPGK
jgi:hypothetical protein